ncbi:hypothetical protein P3L10_030741 [Capsicum annuum]
MFRKQRGRHIQLLKGSTKFTELYKAMKGLGTNDTTFIRIIVMQTEIDMQYIKAEYQKKHMKSPNDVVHSETYGDYRTFLVSLLGPGH